MSHGPFLDQTPISNLPCISLLLHAELMASEVISHSHCTLRLGVNVWGSKCPLPTPLHHSTYQMGTVMFIERKTIISAIVRVYWWQICFHLWYYLWAFRVITHCGYKGSQSNEVTCRQATGLPHWFKCPHFSSTHYLIRTQQKKIFQTCYWFACFWCKCHPSCCEAKYFDGLLNMAKYCLSWLVMNICFLVINPTLLLNSAAAFFLF